EPAFAVVRGYLGATVELGLTSFFLAALVAVPIGVFSAIRRNSLVDHAAMAVALVGQAAPTFYLGILFILLLSLKADLFPTGGRARGGARARRTVRLVMAGLAFVALLGIVAAAAPWLAPHDPTRQALRGRLAPPTRGALDGRARLLGTDQLGRDVLSRVIYGARVSLVVGLAAVVVGGGVGATPGIPAGFRGGVTDSVIMTLADAQLAFPLILLAIGIIAVLGPSFPTLIVVIGLSGWVSYARIL